MAIVMTSNKSDTKIGVYEFVDRKKPRLCVVKGNEIVSYAYFNSMEGAKEFMREFAQFLQVDYKEGDN